MEKQFSAGFLLGILTKMMHSRVDNYAMPGLSSYLITEPSKERGCLRLFIAERDTWLWPITPHSHRFDLTSVVLRGTVWNTLFNYSAGGEPFVEIGQHLIGKFGEYDLNEGGTLGRFSHNTDKYEVGESYFMKHDQIHSIRFSAGAHVLVQEGPQKSESSTVLLPHVGGKTLNTMVLADWQFLTEEKMLKADQEKERQKQIELDQVKGLVIGMEEWECDKSPIGTCQYNSRKDPLHDQCVHCGAPEERK